MRKHKYVHLCSHVYVVPVEIKDNSRSSQVRAGRLENTQTSGGDSKGNEIGRECGQGRRRGSGRGSETKERESTHKHTHTHTHTHMCIMLEGRYWRTHRQARAPVIIACIHLQLHQIFPVGYANLSILLLFRKTCRMIPRGIHLFSNYVA